MLGAAKIGSAIAPLNFRLTPAEMGRIVHDARATVLVVGPVFETALPAILAEAPGLTRVVRTGADFEEWIAGASDVDPGREPSYDDVVLQLYTSGTTGLPKGVQLTNGNCSGLMDVADAWDVDETSVSLVAMPLFHIGGSGWANVALARGGTDVLVPMIDPAALIDTIETGPHHQRVPGPGGAADDVRGARGRRPRLLQPAVHRVRRLADHHGRAEAVAGGVPGAAVPGLRPDRDDRRDHRAGRGRPRPGRPPSAPAPLGRPALPLGGDEGRRPGHRPGLRPGRGRGDLDPRRGRTPPATGTSPPRPRPPSTPTAGCTPATRATSTTRASCSSPTGSRT